MAELVVLQKLHAPELLGLPLIEQGQASIRGYPVSNIALQGDWAASHHWTLPIEATGILPAKVQTGLRQHLPSLASCAASRINADAAVEL